MKKILLIVILVLNILLLGAAGITLYGYLNKSASEIKVKKSQPYNNSQNDKAAGEKDGPIELKVVTKPKNAKIFINGYYKGVSPAKFKIISVTRNDSYKLTVLKEGYNKWENDFNFKAGEKEEFIITLSEKGKNVKSE